MTYSYSKLSCFKECPYKYKLKYIDHISTPFNDSPVFEKGRYIHSILEHWPSVPEFSFLFPEVQSKKDDYLSQIQTVITTQKNIKFLLSEEVCLRREYTFYLDSNFKEVPTKDESLYNGVIDYVGRFNKSLLLVDWKSGQTQNSASFDQLEFYSLWAFNKFNKINRVNCFLMFVEQNKFKNLTIQKKDQEKIQDKYKSMIEKINTTDQFLKNRSSKCEWCPYQLDCIKMN